MSLIALFGPVESAREQVLLAALSGAAAVARLEISPPAAELRAQTRAFRARYEALPNPTAGRLGGLGLPGSPLATPWGRGADQLEQLAIDEELDGVPRPAAGGWLALTLTAVGTPDQQERWVRQALEGTLGICQLFSEPDAAATCVAQDPSGADYGRVDRQRSEGMDQWALTADWGYALVRTDPDAEKNAGISVMMIDMTAPGVDRRPLRQITGDAHFAEVFLDNVFVPDDDVIGEVNQGWGVARTPWATSGW